MIQVQVTNKLWKQAKWIDKNRPFVQLNQVCPVALAVKDKTHKKVSIASNHAMIDGKKYSLCNVGLDIIQRFDEYKQKPKLPAIVTLMLRK